jgi:SMC interacting uncharacterized protein involved in chromosome segregation
MRAIEYPEQAEEGQGELEMPDASSNLVQKQLSELAQQVVHIVQACNEEKELLEDEFESVKANIEILESRIHTDKQRVDSEVAGVGTQMQVQEAVLQEIRSGFNICKRKITRSSKKPMQFSARIKRKWKLSAKGLPIAIAKYWESKEFR